MFTLYQNLILKHPAQIQITNKSFKLHSIKSEYKQNVVIGWIRLLCERTWVCKRYRQGCGWMNWQALSP